MAEAVTTGLSSGSWEGMKDTKSTKDGGGIVVATLVAPWEAGEMETGWPAGARLCVLQVWGCVYDGDTDGTAEAVTTRVLMVSRKSAEDTQARCNKKPGSWDPG